MGLSSLIDQARVQRVAGPLEADGNTGQAVQGGQGGGPLLPAGKGQDRQPHL